MIPPEPEVVGREPKVKLPVLPLLPPSPPSLGETPKGVTPYDPRIEEEVAKVLGMPGVVCNNCPINSKCPQFVPGSDCYYHDHFASLSSRSTDNFIPAMETVADLQMARARRAVFFEQRAGGGVIDGNVTRQLEVAAAALERVFKYKMPVVQAAKQSITVTAETSGPPGAQSPGILTQLVQSMMGQKPPPPPSNELQLNESSHPRVIDTDGVPLPLSSSPDE